MSEEETQRETQGGKREDRKQVVLYKQGGTRCELHTPNMLVINVNFE